MENTNWHNEFYECTDLFYRKDIIEAQTKTNNTKDTKERMKVFEKRYDFSNTPAIDHFISAWLTLRMYNNPSFLSANIKKAKDEIKELSKKLCVIDNEVNDYLKDEWRNFARLYIHTCMNSRTYSARLLFFFKLKEEELAKKIAEDIDYGTRAIPSIAELSEYYLPLREIFIEEYIKMVPNGKMHWEKYKETINTKKNSS